MGDKDVSPWKPGKFLCTMIGINIVLFFALAIWARITSLTTSPDFAADEAFFGVQADHLVRGGLVAGSTASGKPVDIFYTAVEAPLHLVFRPSFTLERVPAVIFGLLAMALTYVLGSRFLDRTTALLAAGIFGALPIAIIYSRLGWEYSEVPLFCILIIYVATRANMVALLLLFLAATHVSPTMVFFAPVPMCVLLAQWIKRASDESAERPREMRKLLMTMVAFAVETVTIGLIKKRSPAVQWTYDTYHYGHCDWPLFFTLLKKHLLGFCERAPTATSRLHDWIFWCPVVAVLVLGSWQLVKQRRWDRMALVLGLIGSASGYHLVVGPGGLHPLMPRYGFFLVVPSALAFACLTRSLLVTPTGAFSAKIRGLQYLALLAVGFALIFSYKANYFDELTKVSMGRESFWTIRSESYDPYSKVAHVLKTDFNRAGVGPGPRTVVTEDWWIYKPLQFLMVRRDEVKIGSMDRVAAEQRPRVVRDRLQAGGYAVGPTGGVVDQIVKATFPPEVLWHWHVHPYEIYRLKAVGESQAARPRVCQFCGSELAGMPAAHVHR